MDEFDKAEKTVLVLMGIITLFLVISVTVAIVARGQVRQELIFEKSGRHVSFIKATQYPSAYFTNISGELEVKKQ